MKDILKELVEVALSLRNNDHKTDMHLNRATDVIKKAQEVLDTMESEVKNEKTEN